MVSLRVFLFISLFGLCVLSGPFMPIMGILAYVGHYCIGPERQWWHSDLRGLRIRYSFFIAIITAVGVVFSWGKLRFGKKILLGQEKLLLLYVALIWVLYFISSTTVGRYTTSGVDHPSMKFTKVAIFVLMMTHVVTDLKKLDWLLWVLIIGVLILGLQANATSRRAFAGGRLDSIGGPDFAEANFFAAFLAAMLPLIAVKFMNSGLFGKFICMLSAYFGMNAIVLTRSRGAMVGLAMGALTAAFMSPRKYRAKILVVLILGGAAGVRIADPQFIDRMSTITRSEDQRDSSAQSRFELWKAAGKMIASNPQGVGAGNFYQNIGKYNSELKGKDAHNTFVRCAAELGVQGITVFLLIIFLALRSVLRVRRRADNLPEEAAHKMVMLSYGMLVCLVTLLACCLTISLTYVEFLWWLLLLPVCLIRVMDNMEEDAGIDEHSDSVRKLEQAKELELKDKPDKPVGGRRRKRRANTWAPLPEPPSDPPT